MAIITSDVLGWWDFQDGSGSTVTDKIASSPTNGSITGATWVTGGPANLPNGLNFNGSSQYVQIPKDYDFGSGAGSIALWINVNTLPTAGQEHYIIDNANAGGELDVFLKGSTSNKLATRSRFGVTDRDINSTISVATSTLYFVVYNFASGAMELFVNNTSAGTNAGTGALSDSGLNLRIGGLVATSGYWYNGKVHQAILLNRTIDASERSALYNAGAGITYDGLFGAAVNSGFFNFF